MKICILGHEALAEREARERAKWNERSPLVFIIYSMHMSASPSEIIAKRNHFNEEELAPSM